MSVGNNLTPLQAVKAIKDLDANKLPRNLGSTASNKTVITDAQGAVQTRKFNENYIIVNSLPEENIDENIVYLLPTDYDPSEGNISGNTSYATTSTLPNNKENIVSSGSDSSPQSVSVSEIKEEVQAMIDNTIKSALEVSY